MLNKRRIIQLKFWKTFQETEKPTLWQFIINQPRSAKAALLILISYYFLTTYFLGYSSMQTGMVITLFLVIFALYFKFRTDWILSKECLDWGKIDELLEREE
ncbi:MAG: hypothetical protein ACPHLK_01905 [Gammaproteobacteria bacterium]